MLNRLKDISRCGCFVYHFPILIRHRGPHLHSNSHYKDQRVSWPPYLYNGNHILECWSLYWNGTQVVEIDISKDKRLKHLDITCVTECWGPAFVPSVLPLQWRHNGRDSVSNHQPHDCLLNRLFRCRSRKTSKFLVTGLCAGNSPGTGEFPAQMARNAENFPFDDVIMTVPDRNPNQNGRHIATDFSSAFLEETFFLLIQLSLKCVPNVPMNNHWTLD